MKESLKARRTMVYSIKDMLSYFICCVSCRKLEKLKRSKAHRRHLYFNVGSDKLTEELDLVHFIKNIRKIKVLTQVLLTNKQKFLLKFMKNNVIDSTSSGTSANEHTLMRKAMEGKDVRTQKILDDKIDKSLGDIRFKKLSKLNEKILNGLVAKKFSDDELNLEEDKESGGSEGNSDNMSPRSNQNSGSNPHDSYRGNPGMEPLSLQPIANLQCLEYSYVSTSVNHLDPTRNDSIYVGGSQRSNVTGKGMVDLKRQATINNGAGKRSSF